MQRVLGPAANVVADLRRVPALAAERDDGGAGVAPEEAAALTVGNAVVRVCNGAKAGMYKTEGVDLDAESRSEDTVARQAEAVRAAIARGGCPEDFKGAGGGLIWAGLVVKEASSSLTDV